jgi:hypothetical protein
MRSARSALGTCISRAHSTGTAPQQSTLARHGTTRHPGYAISQQKRKRTEEPFGWGKTIGGLTVQVHADSGSLRPAQIARGIDMTGRIVVQNEVKIG